MLHFATLFCKHAVSSNFCKIKVVEQQKNVSISLKKETKQWKESERIGKGMIFYEVNLTFPLSIKNLNKG